MLTQDQIPMSTIPAINNAHLEEMILVNRLLEACQKMQTEEVLSLLKSLKEQTQEHFAIEESYMDESHTQHKAEHARHLHELGSLIKYYEKNLQPNAIIAYIEGNLKKWLVHHMESLDMKL